MSHDRREGSRRAADNHASIEADMHTAAFGAAHATSVMQEQTKSEFALLWAELKWHKYLLMILAGGIFGQYMGLDGAVSQAMPFR